MHRLMYFTLCSLFVAASVGAQSFHEPFTTVTYRDAAATTAVWDTAAGEVRLPTVGFSFLGGRSAPGAIRVLRMNNTVILARGSSGVDLFDVTDPAAPSFSANIAISGSPQPNVVDIARSGDVLYVSWSQVISLSPPLFQYGVDVYSIARPGAPVYVNKFVTSLVFQSAQSLTVHGDRLYVATGSSLKIFDISDPTALPGMGVLAISGAPQAVAVAGGIAYVAAGSGGLHVVDVSNSAAPTLLSTQLMSGAAADVAVDGFLACVASGAGGLHLVDVSSPSAPFIAGTFAGAGSAEGVSVDGDVVALAQGSGGIVMVDVTDPSAPSEIRTSTVLTAVHDVLLAGMHVFAADGMGLGAFRGAAGLAPWRVRFSAVGTTPITHMVASGDRLYLADGVLRVYDNRRTVPLTQLGEWGTSFINRFDVDGSFAYAVDASGIFHVLDVSDPATISDIGTVSVGPMADIEASGQVVCGLVGGGTGASGLYTVDVSNPAAPVVVGFYNILGGVFDLAVSGSTVYVAAPIGGVTILSISNPASISLLGTYSMSTTTDVAVAADGNMLYVAGGSGLNDEFEIVDVSVPSVPVKLGGVNTVSGDLVSVQGIALQGNRAIVAGVEGLHIFYISNPSSPWEVHTYLPPVLDLGYSVVAHGNFAYFGLRDFPSGTIHRVEEIRVLDRGLNSGANVARSTAFLTPPYPVQAMRMTPVTTGTVSWEYSPDDGAVFYPRAADGSWENGPGAGAGIRWQATLQLEPGGVAPTASDLVIDWRYDRAIITSIKDVPADEGGLVTLDFLSSGFDVLPVPPVTRYVVYLWSNAAWDSVGVVAPSGLDSYSITVPTVADSTLWDGAVYSTYFVRTHTGGFPEFVDSPQDSSYSIDNIAPDPPSKLTAAYNAPPSNNVLDWKPSESTDVFIQRVYRGATPLFSVGPTTVVDSLMASAPAIWTDLDYHGWDMYYAVTAVDSAGNESLAQYPGVVTDVADRPTPARLALGQNLPNPFNPTTVIPFVVPTGGGRVRLTVFDLSGRMVATLVDREFPAGPHTAVWRGRDDRGRRVASGMYLYRLSAPSGEITRKMTMVQ